MYRYDLLFALELPSPSTNHAILLWVVCIVVSLFFLLLLCLTKGYWKIPTGASAPVVATDRAERSCDAVLSVSALLIPATLGLLTWLHEKVGPGSYVIPLGFALLYFFALLVFTTYLRFNFLWRFDKQLVVSSNDNMSFAYWLTTATSSIVLGIGLLSIPVVGLALGWLNVKETPPEGPAPATSVECHCAPAQSIPPVLTPPKPVHHRHHKAQTCGTSQPTN